MAFKTFAPGVLASSDVNTFLMRQSVITCTSSTRPASPNEGMFIYETDTDLFVFYTGTAWQSIAGPATYTPTLGGGWAIGNGTLIASFMENGKTVVWRVWIAWGSTSVFGASPLTVTLPRASVSAPGHVSQVNSFDVSPGATYAGTVGVVSATVVQPHTIGSSGVWAAITNTSPFTWAASDNFSVSGIYEKA